MARKTITVNGLEFTTKKALEDKIRQIRDSYQDGKLLNEQDFTFMLDLLERHPRAKLKIGCGVIAMYVQHNEGYKHNREFWLIRVDGSKTDFSFKQCLTPKPHIQKVKEACRKAIQQIIIDFKLAFFREFGDIVHCEITGQEMTLYHNSHVDHMLPNTFNTIFYSFIEDYKIDLQKVELNEKIDGLTGREFVDKDIEQKFIDYHNCVARLRVISKEANLRLPKK